MSLIKDKEIIFNIEVSEELENKLFEKQTYFYEKIYPNYSLKEKDCYMRSNNIGRSSFIIVLLSLIGAPIYFATAFNLELNHYFNAFLCFLGGPFISFLWTIPFIHRAISKQWLSKEKNEILLKNMMFWDSIIDQETMKDFVQCYGKEEMVKLMLSKENLKYKDVSNYIEKQKSEEKEKLKLSEIVECLT